MGLPIFVYRWALVRDCQYWQSDSFFSWQPKARGMSERKSCPVFLQNRQFAASWERIVHSKQRAYAGGTAFVTGFSPFSTFFPELGASDTQNRFRHDGKASRCNGGIAILAQSEIGIVTKALQGTSEGGFTSLGLPEGRFVHAFAVDGFHPGESADGGIGSHGTGSLLEGGDGLFGLQEFFPDSGFKGELVVAVHVASFAGG